MTKQIRHERTSKKGKRFFAGKRVNNRWFIARDYGKKQPIWTLKKLSDKEMGYFPLVEYRQYKSSPFGDADHDGIVNIMDRAPLDVRIRKQVPPGIKAGNLKLQKSIGVFSLPRYYTCPGKTKLCSAYCYAESPEKMRGGVVYSRNKNYAWTQRPDFVKVVSEMIHNMKFDWFRIHESGDFYNQEYLDKWLEIVRNNPQTKFLAYTKNWHLNFKNLPSNICIRYSCDISSEHLRDELPICYVGVKIPKQFFLCRKKCKPGFCMACWDRSTDVYIPIHSISKKNVDHMFFKQFNPEVPPQLERRALTKFKFPHHQIKLLTGGNVS